MILVSRNGHQILQLSTAEAGVLRSLLCASSPRGQAAHGRLEVRVYGDAAPVPPDDHSPIEEQ